MRAWETSSPQATEEVGEALAGELAPDGAVLLHGELGVGKTVLVRGIAAGLGLDPREIQSPSFTLVREHDSGRARLLHVDLYRLDPVEVAAIGLEDLLAGPGVKVVEWAGRLPFPAPAGAVRLEIERLADDRRRIRELPAEAP